MVDRPGLTLAIASILLTPACTPGGSGIAAADDRQNRAASGTNFGERERPAAMRLLTYPTRPKAVYPSIGMRGTLVLDGDCLMFLTGTGRYLIYFPREMVQVDLAGQGLRQGRTLIPLGSRIELNGMVHEAGARIASLDDPGPCDAGKIFTAFPGAIRLL